MACTVTVDMTGLLAKLDTMNTHLADINASLVAMVSGNAIGAIANVLSGPESAIVKLGAAVISSVLQTASGDSPIDYRDDLIALRRAIKADADINSLANRIVADDSPSLGQRILQSENDEIFGDVGCLSDRLGPLPFDNQVEATNVAWALSPGTQNVAEAIDDLDFHGYPIPGGLP